MPWTADDLLTLVKARAQLPSTTNGKLSDADILLLADAEMATTVAEVVRSAREELWVKWTDTSLVSGQRDYRIPSRAQGANLREVKIQDANGEFYDLPRKDLEEIDYFRGERVGERVCAVVGDFLRIAPDPSDASDTLRFYYYRRPNKLVKTTETTDGRAVSQITTVTSTTSVDVGTANHSSGDEVDIIQATPNFDSHGDDITLTVSSNTYTLGTAADSDMAVGDYVCDAGYSPVLQIPDVLHPLLERATVVSALEAVGASASRISVAQKKLEDMMGKAERMLQKRVEGAPTAIVSPTSPLRARRSYRGWS